MSSPFPGMNPYLENPELWTEVHHRLITALAIAIESNLNQDYRVAIEKRVYSSVPEDTILVGIPDAAVVSRSSSSQRTTTLTSRNPDSSVTVILPIPQEIREGYLEVRDIVTGAVITTIEILSPTNKRPGKGKNAYESKRNAVLETATHLVEIDLLREGDPMTMLSNFPSSDYRILVSRAEQRPRAQLYAFNLEQVIPTFSIPLKPGEVEILVDLQSLLQQIYNQARYDLVIDYQQEPIPPLEKTDRIWMDTLLRDKGLRC
jgi:hypothetical protein